MTYNRDARIRAVFSLLTALLFCSPCAAQEAASTTRSGAASTPIGDVVQGLALSLTPQEMSARLGEPVWVTVELRNASERPERIFLYARPSFEQPWNNANYNFTIVDQSTATTVPLKITPLDSGYPVVIPVGSHQLAAHGSLFARIRLDHFYDFTAPGTYAVIVNSFVRYIYPTDPTSVLVQSNPVRITMLPSLQHRSSSPDSSHSLSINLQTDRPIYTVGMPVYIRLSITNISREAVSLGQAYAGTICSILLLDASGNPLSPPLGGAQPFTQGIFNSQLQPGKTITLSYVDDWVSLERWALMFYKQPNPGDYTLSAFTTVGGRSAAKPLHIKVLSKVDAASLTPQALDDARLDGSIRVLLAQYYKVLERTTTLIARVHSASEARDLFWRLGSAWSDNGGEQSFEDSMRSLPVGNPTSPYVNVLANLMESTRYLSRVTDAAREMLPPNGPNHQNYMPAPLSETAPGPIETSSPLPADLQCKLNVVVSEFAASKYFYNAVRLEIEHGYAGVGDAINPPPVSTASKCS